MIIPNNVNPLRGFDDPVLHPSTDMDPLTGIGGHGIRIVSTDMDPLRGCRARGDWWV